MTPSPGGGMVDALVSGASGESRAGSSPVLGTPKRLKEVVITDLSRFLYFLQANYRQNSNISLNFRSQVRIDGIREQSPK